VRGWVVPRSYIANEPSRWLVFTKTAGACRRGKGSLSEGPRGLEAPAPRYPGGLLRIRKRSPAKLIERPPRGSEALALAHGMNVGLNGGAAGNSSLTSPMVQPWYTPFSDDRLTAVTRGT